MTQDNTPLTAQERETRAAYFREWRARNKAKVKLYNQRYWQKKLPSAKTMKGRQTMVPFQKIPDAVKSTGLSAYFLRQGCKAGTVPHVMSGGTYYINIPALLRQLGADDGKETQN